MPEEPLVCLSCRVLPGLLGPEPGSSGCWLFSARVEPLDLSLCPEGSEEGLSGRPEVCGLAFKEL